MLGPVDGYLLASGENRIRACELAAPLAAPFARGGGISANANLGFGFGFGGDGGRAPMIFLSGRGSPMERAMAQASSYSSSLSKNNGDAALGGVGAFCAFGGLPSIIDIANAIASISSSDISFGLIPGGVGTRSGGVRIRGGGVGTRTGIGNGSGMTMLRTRKPGGT